jgi:hypothetical protein
MATSETAEGWIPNKLNKTRSNVIIVENQSSAAENFL